MTAEQVEAGECKIVITRHHQPLTLCITGKKAEAVKRKLEQVQQQQHNLKTVRLKLYGEDTHERLAMPAAPQKRAVATQGRTAGGTSAAEVDPYRKEYNGKRSRA